jgi:hypothetical protein
MNRMIRTRFLQRCALGLQFQGVLLQNDRRFQVFVSSTFKDLTDERQKVFQAILEMRAFPAGMELFPSADEEQMEFIRNEILSSDYLCARGGGEIWLYRGGQRQLH